MSNLTEANVKQKAPVGNWLMRLEEEICRADELVEAMSTRISSVLSEVPQLNREVQSPSTPEESLSPLADRIRTMAHRLEHISDRYNYMLEALEL